MSSVLCDVGYSDEHWLLDVGKCVCGKKGRLLGEAGWIGTRWLHLNKTKRCYFEIGDEHLSYERQASLKEYEVIKNHGLKVLAKIEKAKDKTGRCCQMCGSTRGIGYYGEWYKGFDCFCKPCHAKWLRSPQYDEWLKQRSFV